MAGDDATTCYGLKVADLLKNGQAVPLDGDESITTDADGSNHLLGEGKGNNGGGGWIKNEKNNQYE